MYNRTFLYMYLFVRKIRGFIFKLPSINILRVPIALISLSIHRTFKVHSWVSRLNTGTTKQIVYTWYLRRLSSQGLTHISFIFFYLTYRVVFFTNGCTVSLVITWGIPRLHRAIRAVETYQLIPMQRMSGSTAPLSDHPYDPLTRLTSRRHVCSERQSEHLNIVGLRRCHPITVKPLTVRGSKKHPSTLTNLLSG